MKTGCLQGGSDLVHGCFQLRIRSPPDSCGTGRGAHQTKQHAQSGGFARAVWPEKTGDVPRLDSKRKVADGNNRTKMLREVVDFNNAVVLIGHSAMLTDHAVLLGKTCKRTRKISESILISKAS